MKPIARNDGVDRTVVRNAAYRKSAVGIRERHNERKNASYSNPDVMREYSDRNVHFKKCETTYAQAFDRLLEDGTISTRGQKPDAKVIDEMIFDVNTAYFDRNGGYEYAKEFFAHAYDMAVQEAGGEQYVLSAVMHADERNRELSEKLGRDVFHYHLHVVYVPVVKKEIRWSKRCKDKSLIGTVKETVMQVSHSKKWKSERLVDIEGVPERNERGTAKIVHSYSYLQDRFFEHMRNAGYDDIARGERHSKETYLTPEEFKRERERMKRIAELEQKIAEREQKHEQLKQQIKLDMAKYRTFDEIDNTGKRNLLGKYEMTEQDYRELTTLAKEGISSRSIIRDLKEQMRLGAERFKDMRDRFNRLLADTKDYREAITVAPERVKDFIAEIIERARQEKALQRQHRLEQKRSRKSDDIER